MTSSRISKERSARREVGKEFDGLRRSAVADQRVILHRRLSLSFPASLETYQREHWDLALLRPVALTARPPSSENGLDAKLKEIEEFVIRHLGDIHSLLTGDVQRPKSELTKHCTEITLPSEGQIYQISGNRTLLGGRSDGAGGQNRTGYARLFRAALYQ